MLQERIKISIVVPVLLLARQLLNIHYTWALNHLRLIKAEGYSRIVDAFGPSLAPTDISEQIPFIQRIDPVS